MNLREASRQDWNADKSLEAIKVGSLQRIADALEKQNEILQAQNRLHERLWKLESKVESVKRKLMKQIREALGGTILS